MLLLLLVPLLSTILLELGVLWLLKERRRKVLWASVGVNVLTNVPLNLYILLEHCPLSHILVGEVLVVVVEAVWYLLFTRSLRQACIYSLLCNAVSYFVGLLVQSLYAYIHTFI